MVKVWDILGLLLIVYFVYRGYRKGAIAALVDWLGTIASFIIGRLLAEPLSAALLANQSYRAFISRYINNRVLPMIYKLGESLEGLLGGYVHFDNVIEQGVDSAVSSITHTLAFFLVFFLALAIFFILRRFALGFNKLPVLGTLNRLLGAIFGFAYGGVLYLLLIWVVAFFAVLFNNQTLLGNIQSGLLSGWVYSLFI